MNMKSHTEQSMLPDNKELKMYLQTFIDMFDKREDISAFKDMVHSLSGIFSLLSYCAVSYGRDESFAEIKELSQQATARMLLILFSEYHEKFDFTCIDGQIFDGIDLEQSSGDDIFNWISTLVRCFGVTSSILPVKSKNGGMALFSLFDYIKELPFEDENYREYITSYVMVIFSMSSGLFDEYDIYKLYGINPILFDLPLIGKIAK